MSPLSSFGGGDGWLAPGEGGYAYLGTGNLERGFAYGNGQLYLVSRNGGNNVRILNSSTGVEIGSLNTTGTANTGDTFDVNMVGVGGDGRIYVGNLATAGQTFRVFRWDTDISTPGLVYETAGGPRLGDSFDVIGSGAATRVVASGSGTTGFLVLDPTLGISDPGDLVVTGAAGDFRLGLTFVDADTVWGTQGSATSTLVDFVGNTPTLLGNPALTAASERPMDFVSFGGYDLLATIDTTSSIVRVYNVSDPLNPVLLDSMTTTSGSLTANANGTGTVAWGQSSGDSINLYAMSSNQGIQAFVVTVPEPGTMVLGALGAGMLYFWNRRRKN